MPRIAHRGSHTVEPSRTPLGNSVTETFTVDIHPVSLHPTEEVFGVMGDSLVSVWSLIDNATKEVERLLPRRA